MGRLFFVIALIAAGALVWRSGRLDPILHTNLTALERKAKAALDEGGWEEATVEQRDEGIFVHVPLERDSERWRAADEGRRACTRVAEALGGEHNVSVLVLGEVSESGGALVYGSAGYTTSGHGVSWQPYN
jgi:hypothetical protein